MQRIDKDAARKFRGARWSLMKNPDNLNDRQAKQLRQIWRQGGEVWRAYALKEALRGVFDRSLEPRDAVELLDRFCDKAQRSRLAPFVKVAKDDPPAPLRHRQRAAPSAVQRARRGPQQPRAAHRTSRLRLPLSEGGPGARPAHVRTGDASSSTRAVQVMGAPTATSTSGEPGIVLHEHMIA